MWHAVGNGLQNGFFYFCLFAVLKETLEDTFKERREACHLILSLRNILQRRGTFLTMPKQGEARHKALQSMLLKSNIS